MDAPTESRLGAPAHYAPAHYAPGHAHRHHAAGHAHRHHAAPRPSWWRRPSRLGGLVLTALVLAAAPALATLRTESAPGVGCGRPTWVGAWGASPQLSSSAYAGRTVRDVVRVRAGGDAVRVRLTNVLGSRPLTFQAATIARAAGAARVDPATLRPLTAAGRRAITVPPGRSLLTDPVELAVTAGEELAVSVAVPPGAEVTTHDRSLRRSWVSAPGDHTDETGAQSFGETTLAWPAVSAVDVHAPGAAAAVVALGDSLTAGLGTPTDADLRWTDDLAGLLPRRDDGQRPVVNAAITGNYLLRDDPDFGLSAVTRLGRDVLGVAAARDAVVLVGLNDFARLPGTSDVPEVQQGLRELVARLHAGGLRVTGVTYPPTGDAGSPVPYGDYSSPRSRVDRTGLNDWIRTSGTFDAVADADAALRDPAHPERLLPAYDGGDRLHLSAAGYAELARTVARVLPPGPCAG